MRKRNVTRFNKEKIMMLASSLLIVTACSLTGYYVNQKEKEGMESQVVDFSELEESANTDTDMTGNAVAGIERDLDADPYFAETGGNSVINPDTQKTVSENSADISEIYQEEKQEKEKKQDDREKQEDKEAEETVSQSVKQYAFVEKDGMGWPVLGNIVLNYSMDQTIYFSTLSQYKYNPAVLISAKEGDNVCACAAGKVCAVGTSEEIGNYVEIDLGNDYMLLLGQLQEITVSEGEIVERGQVIGTVAAPTKYYSLEGTNVYLKITKENNPVNPMSLLD